MGTKSTDSHDAGSLVTADQARAHFGAYLSEAQLQFLLAAAGDPKHWHHAAAGAELLSFYGLDGWLLDPENDYALLHPRIAREVLETQAARFDLTQKLHEVMRQLEETLAEILDPNALTAEEQDISDSSPRLNRVFQDEVRLLLDSASDPGHPDYASSRAKLLEYFYSDSVGDIKTGSGFARKFLSTVSKKMGRYPELLQVIRSAEEDLPEIFSEDREPQLKPPV